MDLRKMDRNYGIRDGVDFVGTEQGLMGHVYDHGHEASGSIKAENILAS
jgi:hypothetical protein